MKLFWYLLLLFCTTLNTIYRNNIVENTKSFGTQNCDSEAMFDSDYDYEDFLIDVPTQNDDVTDLVNDVQYYNYGSFFTLIIIEFVSLCVVVNLTKLLHLKIRKFLENLKNENIYTCDNDSSVRVSEVISDGNVEQFVEEDQIDYVKENDPEEISDVDNKRQNAFYLTYSFPKFYLTRRNTTSANAVIPYRLHCVQSTGHVAKIF